MTNGPNNAEQDNFPKIAAEKEALRRWDVVLAKNSQTFKKPRPALVVFPEIQELPNCVVICPFYSKALLAMPCARYVILPSEQNGLKRLSQVGIDKLFVVERSHCIERYGSLDIIDAAIVDSFLTESTLRALINDLEQRLPTDG